MDSSAIIITWHRVPKTIARLCRSRLSKIGLKRAFALALLTSAVCGCHNRLSTRDIESLDAAPPIARLVTAHRGNLHHGELPDNSIPAIREAAAAGVPFLEVDVRRSDSGDLFLFHDGSVSRSNSYAPPSLQGRPIQTLTSDEREQVFLDSNRAIHVPTLAEALDAVRDANSSLQIDLKQESDDLLFDVLYLISDRNQISQVIIQVRQPARISMVRATFPKARILARCRTREALDAALAQKVEFVELEGWATSDAIASAHEANARVLINVAASELDEHSTWRHLRSRGIDSVMTNYADLAKEPLP